MKDTVIKLARCVLAAALLAGALYLLVQCIHNNRTVATMDGNQIHYNGQVYTEYLRNLSFETGRCLGKVEFSDFDTRLKLYTIRGMPDYLYVDMGWDYRIYKIPSD